MSAVAFFFSLSFDVFGGLHRRLDGAPNSADAVLGIAVILVFAVTAFAVARGREARAEQALRAASEQRYRAIVEQQPGITYTWDPDAGPDGSPTVYISPQVERLLGYTPEEWLADPELWVRCLHANDRDRVLEASHRSDRDGAAFREEYRTYTKDGRLVWVRDESIPVSLDLRGRPTLLQGVIYDITAQKEAEARLAEAENRFRTIVERVPAVAYVWDAADQPGDVPAAYISPQIERLIGFTAREWLDDPTRWAQQVHPEDLPAVLDAWASAVAKDLPFVAEYRIRRADGAEIWLRDEAVPVGPGDRGHAVYQGVMIDVSEQREALGRLGEAEERFRRLVEQIPAITFSEDPATGTLLYVSPQIENMLGYRPEEWLLDPDLWAELLHPDDRAWVIAANDADTGDSWSVDYRVITRDGRNLWVHHETVLIRDDQDEPLFWQGMIFDISQRKAAEQGLRDAEERYRTLVEQLPVVVYMDAVDDVATALYVSPQYERLTGYTPAERLAEPGLWLRMLHPDDRDRVTSESDRVNETGEPFDIEYRLVRGDGEVVWVHDHAYMVDLPGGHTAWQGVLTDVSDRHAALEALGRRDLVLRATAFAAERFLLAATWEEALDDVLARLGQAVDASRVYVYRNHHEGPEVLMSQHAEWVAPGVAVTMHDPENQSFPYASGFQRWRELLSSGQVVHGPVSMHPTDERRDAELEDVKSLCVVPIRAAGGWWGFMGFDDCERPRRWTNAEMESLRVAADTLGAAIGRQEGDRRLTETQARYRTLVEQIPAVTYMESSDPPGTKLYISPQIDDLFGFTPEEWNIDVWRAQMHPDDRERVLAEDARTNETGEPFDIEYRSITREGRTVWVLDQAVLLRDTEGKPLYWQGVRFDITDRMEAEQQLREAEERFRAIVEHVPSAIYLDAADESMRTVYISPQIEAITGISASEWVADPLAWRNAIDPEDRDRVLEGYLPAARRREPWSDEYRLRTRDGRQIWVHDETTLLATGDAGPTFMQGVISDITERKLAERTLRESEQREREAADRLRALDDMKNTFLAAVSHELRSPLTAILGLSLTLERTGGISEEDRDDLVVRLSANAKKLDRLLKDLLDIDRLNRGIVEPAYRATDIGALAQRTLESLDSLADRAVVSALGSVVVRADPAKVERIIENLLTNAARHTGPDRRIWLRVEGVDAGAMIAVEDDGPGVPPEIRAEIFEAFRQGPTASPHSPGTGIGLSLVARFAALHGGRAWVDEREGGGASFKVFLPEMPPGDDVGLEPDRPRGSLRAIDAG
ncbi:MAG: PAS domain-containing protein [Actinomycetota bacterium]